MFEGSAATPSLVFEEITSAPEPVRLAKLLSDAASAIENDRDSALLLLQQAVSLMQFQPRNAEQQKAVPSQPSLAPWQMKRVTEYIHNHLHESISLRELANVARLSSSHFSRAFKGAFGRPPHAFIMSKRIELARQTMLESQLQLSQIALSCGFADQAHLTRMFRKQTGFAPNQWRRAHQPGP